MAGLHIENNKGWQFKWEFWEDNIIKEYYPKNGVNKVLELLPHRNINGIQSRAFKLGVKYLNYNRNYFNVIDSETKSYWLGFIYTDGYVTTNNRWGLELSIVDLEHMEKLLNDMDCNINIKIRERVNSKTCSFQIHNSIMYKDLVNNGVLQNKTNLLTFPSEDIVDPKYYSHFIRGLFDGDGCIYFNYIPKLRKDRNNKIYNTLIKHISFVCKSNEFIIDLKDIIYNECNVKFRLTTDKRSDLPTLVTSKTEDILNFLDYIYNDLDSSRYLERKYNKAQELYCHLQQ